MADGYARAPGKPGVCVLITGPGVVNAGTAIGQALSDFRAHAGAQQRQCARRPRQGPRPAA